MKKYFFRWWVLVCLIITGGVFLQIYNIFDLIYHNDVTKISFIIMALFVFNTGRIALIIKKPTFKGYEKVRVVNFWCEKFVTMGIIGTVLGFIYMLHTCFVGLDPTNPVKMQAALTNMSTGMSTALFTTATGLICGLLLKLQIFNLQQALEKCSEK